MVEGDYFIIDDTSPDGPLISGQGLLLDSYDRFGTTKLELVEKFLTSKEDAYKVDCFYTDFFG